MERLLHFWKKQSNETSWVFLLLKFTCHFLPQSSVLQVRFEFKTNFNCWHKSEAQSHLEYRIVLSTSIAILQITLSWKPLISWRKKIGRRMEPWGTMATLSWRSLIYCRKKQMTKNGALRNTGMMGNSYKNTKKPRAIYYKEMKK